MAKKKEGEAKVNKSEMLRAILTETPDISAKDAVAQLASKGVETSEAAFYQVKQKMRGGATGKKGGKSGGTFSIEDIKAMQEVTAKLGLERTIELAKALAK